jgi:hypothetical protein
LVGEQVILLRHRPQYLPSAREAPRENSAALDQLDPVAV